MPDIAIVWNQAAGCGDWAMAGADLAQGQDLESAVLLSLFTDARATADYVGPAPWDGRRRGHWTDTYNGYLIGSLLWTLDRALRNQATLNLAQRYAADALQWLIDCGAVASFTIKAFFVNRSGLGLTITAHKPGGSTQAFAYSWVWDAIG